MIALALGDFYAALSALAVLAGLAVIGGGLWAVARNSASDTRLKRTQDERDDYKGRLDWIEPRHQRLEEQNKLLMELHNPTAQLDKLSTNQREGNARILEVLQAQSQLLHDIDEKLPHTKGDK